MVQVGDRVSFTGRITRYHRGEAVVVGVHKTTISVVQDNERDDFLIETAPTIICDVEDVVFEG